MAKRTGSSIPPNMARLPGVVSWLSSARRHSHGTTCSRSEDSKCFPENSMCTRTMEGNRTTGIRARKRPAGAGAGPTCTCGSSIQQLKPFWRAFSADEVKLGQMVFCIFMSKTRFAPHGRE